MKQIIGFLIINAGFVAHILSQDLKQNLYLASGTAASTLAATLHSKEGSENDNNLTKAKQYNVLFIAVDDLRPELGCYGANYIYSPNIDRLAAGGMAFTRAYCQQAVCSPSRTSMLTGLRPDATGVYNLVTHFRENVPDVITLPQYFKQNGYYSTGFGKVFHIDDKPSWSEPVVTSQSITAQTSLKEVNSKKKDTSNNKRGPAFEKGDGVDSAYMDGKIALRAIEKLRRLKGQPFFLAVGFLRPHLPFIAPGKYWDLYDPSKIKVPDTLPPKKVSSFATTDWGELRSYQDIPKQGNLTTELSRQLIHGYYASVSFMDAQVGLLLNELKSLGLDKNTIVVLWGDHGWKLGEYGDWTKHTNFELDTRVPLIISIPGMQNKIKTTKSLVELVDVYPTLCELTGLPIPAHLQGTSFLPLLNNPGNKWKNAAFSQYPRGKNIMGYTIRTDRYRFTQWINKFSNQVADIELYDLQNDPKGLVNIAHEQDQANKVKELSNMMAQGWQKSHPKDQTIKNKWPLQKTFIISSSLINTLYSAIAFPYTILL